MYGEMVDKEQQINESNQMYGQLQDQLELMLDTIARETNDIKLLEQQLNEGTVKIRNISDTRKNIVIILKFEHCVLQYSNALQKTQTNDKQCRLRSDCSCCSS